MCKKKKKKQVKNLDKLTKTNVQKKRRRSK